MPALLLILLFPFALYAQQSTDQSLKSSDQLLKSPGQFLKNSDQRLKSSDQSLKSPGQLLKNALKGNWFKIDGSKEWKVSFLDTAILYKSQVWKYAIKAPTKGDNWVVQLDNSKGQKVLYVKRDGKGNYKFGESLKHLEGYSQSPVDRAGYKDKNDVAFKLPLLKHDSVSYSGYLKGYTANSGFKSGKIEVSNLFTGKRTSYAINVNAEGSFFVRFPINYPNQLYVSFPGYDRDLYFEPGEDLFQLIDFSNETKTSLFMGSTAKTNRDLLAMRSLGFVNANEVAEKMKGFEPEAYKKYLDMLQDSLLRELKKGHAVQKTGEKADELKALDVKYNIATLKANYISITNGSIKTVLDSTYFSFIKDLPLDSQLSLISEHYRIFLTYLKSADFVIADKFISNEVNYEEIFKEALLEGGFTDNEVGMMQTFLLMKPVNAATNTRTIQDFESNYPGSKMDDFIKAHDGKMTRIATGLRERRRYAKMKRVYNWKSDFIPEVFYMQDLYETLEATETAFTVKTRLNMKSKFSNSFIFSELERINAMVAAQAGNSKPRPVVVADPEEGNVSQVPLGNKIEKSAEEDVFSAIIKKYKGKVILIDLWATWCAPCLAEIESIAPFKQQMDQENVIFLYITNETSPVARYNKMIGTIKGEHFRVNKAEWTALVNQFNISGIPRKILVDKNGAVVNPYYVYSDYATLKDQLLAQVNK